RGPDEGHDQCLFPGNRRRDDQLAAVCDGRGGHRGDVPPAVRDERRPAGRRAARPDPDRPHRVDPVGRARLSRTGQGRLVPHPDGRRRPGPRRRRPRARQVALAGQGVRTGGEAGGKARWERRPRRRPLMSRLGGAGSLGAGAATSYWWLLAARVALGVVTATAGPAVASLTGDYFPAADRARIYGLITGGDLAGSGLGYLVSGDLVLREDPAGRPLWWAVR